MTPNPALQRPTTTLRVAVVPPLIGSVSFQGDPPACVTIRLSLSVTRAARPRQERGRGRLLVPRHEPLRPPSVRGGAPACGARSSAR